MPEKIQKAPLIQDGDYVVEKVVELNFFDLSGEKSNTKGTSSKFYHIELQKSKKDSSAQIYTTWGPTGFAGTREWRYYQDTPKAEKDFGSIIKSKVKKGYKEIDVAQRIYGSEEAKQITKAVVLKNSEELKSQTKTSNLDKNTQYLINSLFGKTANFVSTVLKCPLGQLTNKQIDEGRARLDLAKDIVNVGKLSKHDLNNLQNLTNEFYALIPHNLGQGSRGQMTHLLLDDPIKIAQKDQDLDDLLDAKLVGAQLTSDDVDDKYRSLNSSIEPLDNNDPIFSWIQNMMTGTKASNHYHLGKIKLLNVWKLLRKNENDIFIKNSERIAKEYGKQVIPDVLRNYVQERPDLTKDLESLYSKSNTLPLWHGTRSSSLVGIIRNGLLIRPSGAVISGAMYGSAIYKGMASKSINYTNIKSSYWANGQDDKAFMFLSDVTLGNQKIADRPYQYTKQNIRPYHSVWAKGGYSGVINDEFMLYDQAGSNQQYCIKYIVEFTCIKK